MSKTVISPGFKSDWNQFYFSGIKGKIRDFREFLDLGICGWAVREISLYEKFF